MTWLLWVVIIIGAWVLVSAPLSLLIGRVLRSRDPLAGVPLIAEEDRRPLPPALRTAPAHA